MNDIAKVLERAGNLLTASRDPRDVLDGKDLLALATALNGLEALPKHALRSCEDDVRMVEFDLESLRDEIMQVERRLGVLEEHLGLGG